MGPGRPLQILCFVGLLLLFVKSGMGLPSDGIIDQEKCDLPATPVGCLWSLCWFSNFSIALESPGGLGNRPITGPTPALNGCGLRTEVLDYYQVLTAAAAVGSEKHRSRTARETIESSEG